jgi:23S rRNA G2069 N7-methylase RlmK/C1962 C5-methylase RlmI
MKTRMTHLSHMEGTARFCTFYSNFRTKLVDHAIRNGWRSAQKALKLIPGETIWPDPVK